MLSAPVYVFIELHPQTHMEGRICDLYQFSFLFSQHIGRWSLLAISIDRLLAIKFPFPYQDNIRKHKKQSLTLLACMWVAIMIVTAVPFSTKVQDHNHPRDTCGYQPSRVWTIAVITIFNIIPFLLIAVNYILIWHIAARVAVKESSIRSSLISSSSENSDGGNTHLMNQLLSEFSLYSVPIIPALSASPIPQPSQRSHITSNKSRRQSDNRTSVRNSSEPHIFQRSQSNSIRKFSMLTPAMSRRLSVGSSKLKVFLELKATRRSFVLLLMYAMCWGPYGLFFMVDCFCDHCLVNKYHHAQSVVEHLAFSSSVLAPTAHCWWNRSYRKSLWRILSKRGQRPLSCVKTFEGSSC